MVGAGACGVGEGEGDAVGEGTAVGVAEVAGTVEGAGVEEAVGTVAGKLVGGDELFEVHDDNARDNATSNNRDSP